MWKGRPDPVVIDGSLVIQGCSILNYGKVGVNWWCTKGGSNEKSPHFGRRMLPTDAGETLVDMPKTRCKTRYKPRLKVTACVS